MDNVTQRQNHISGLSEGFTYDALDRLTQSSTTGKIDDVMDLLPFLVMLPLAS
jgi:hypothetical protein